jgi:penicillin-binding protein 2
MKLFPRWAIVIVNLAVLASLAVGCAEVPASPTATTAPTVQTAPTATPDLPPADEKAYAFLQAWERGDYAAMYSLLSWTSQTKISEQEFSASYQQVAEEATLLGVRTRILGAYQPQARAEVSFSVTFQTSLVGEFEVQNQMPLVFENDRWGVEWSESVILPQLSDETFVRMTTWAPSRGNIYDRHGLGLAVQGEQVEIGVVPGQMEDEAGLLALLSEILGGSWADLQARYASALPDWYVPMGRVGPDTAVLYYDALTSTPGVQLREAWTRSYREENSAPHIVGVIGPIGAGELEQWRARGYSGDEMVGQTGLERWGEAYLAGERGGRLEIAADSGQLIAVLAERPSQESSSLYTTLDREFQATVQEILGERLGAIAVLEAQTGRVLALATYPLFDPNLFATGISTWDWQNLQADSRRPLVHRATQAAYPPGSVFKVITMAAAMEAGGLTARSSFLCQGNWTGLGPEWPKVCWLRRGHGNISLEKALTASCDITFYQVGLVLNGLGQEVLPQYAQYFGLGAVTGIEVEEDPGLVPDPGWKIQTKGEGWAPGDTVNLAIGQGEMLASPLQIATMMAAVGNGGTLYRPHVVEMVAADPSDPVWSLQPEVVAKLPVSAGNLAVIQESLHLVTEAAYGTAYQAFEGLEMPVAGKTGTAESGQEEPHAWFAGYAPAQDPEIAIAVIVEHSGEGSVFAAPLFRKVVEAYFGIQTELTPTPEATSQP